MQTKEIQPNEWPKFFDDFSRKHQGMPVDIEILAAEIGAQTEEKGLALEGISVERDETSGPRIMIMTGASADDHISHFINHPMQVTVEQSDDGTDVALAIKEADGPTALLRFKSPALLEAAHAVPS